MVIHRLAPGEEAPWSGRYRLVAQYGEPMGRMVSVRRGERLPLVEVEADSELWFVREDAPGEALNAA